MASLPKLSIRLHGGLPPQLCVDRARLAEQAGFHGVWFAENPFARGVLPAAAAAAAVTERILIGPGVFNPFGRHPTLMAMEIGALDELANGRARLGIGAGIASAVERMGFSYQRPLGAVRDAVTIVRGMLAGERVTHQGRTFSANAAKLDFEARSDIPIFLAGRGEKMLKLVGEVGDGLLVSNMCTPAFSARAAGLVGAARQASGWPGSAQIVQYLPCSAWPDRQKAMLAAKAAVAEMLPAYWATGKRLAGAKDAMMEGSGISEAEFETAAGRLSRGEPAAEVLDDRFVAAFAIAGTAEDCLRQAAERGRQGASELALTFAGSTAGEEMTYLAAAAA